MIAQNTMQIILKAVDEGKSEASIQARYKWFRRQYVPSMRNCVVAGGSGKTKMQAINDFVVFKFTEARAKFLPVHNYHLIDWAREEAARVNATDFFTASHTWVTNFKKRYGITSRAITEYSSQTEKEETEEILNSIAAFQGDYLEQEIFYPRKLIWNVDQTGFNYEFVNKRTLSWRGERDTIVNVNSKNRQTHSYTSQPIISRDGRVIGKILICLQEPDGSFGPIIEPKVRQLERFLGNIKVFASKSGKMSTSLMKDWLADVLVPAHDENIGPDDGHTEIYDYSENNIGTMAIDDNSFDGSRSGKSNVLILMDSWSGQTNADFQARLRENYIEPFIIPKLTTSELQPLDITFNRQYKKFLKRITERALYENLIRNITSREGIIKVHAYIWDQFSSSQYQDMLRYAWRKADINFVNQELVSGPPPRMVQDIQFEFDLASRCEFNCSNKAFIRCAHTGKLACLKHFLGGQCSHARHESHRHYDGDAWLAQEAGMPVNYTII